MNDPVSIYRDKFLINKKEFSGVVGKNISDDDLLAMLEIEGDASDEIKGKIERGELEAGYLREKLMAFQVSSDKTLGATPPWQNRIYKGITKPAPHIGRKSRINGKSLDYLRDFDYQDKIGKRFKRSKREKDYQEKNKRDDGKSPITYGKMLLEIDYEGKTPRAKFMGKRLVAGSSGTAMRLLRSCLDLEMTTSDILNFRLALIGCMIPEYNPSLYEILQGAQEVGITCG